MTRRRAVGWSVGLGVPVLLIVVLALVWNWDWFIPLVQSRASAAIGRKVTIGHLHIGLGSPLRVVADDVTIDNPPRWQGPPLAHVDHLTLAVRLWPFITHRQLILPLIALDHPTLRLVQQPDGQDNYSLKLNGGGGGHTEIGDLQISQGEIAAQLAKLKSDMVIDTHTQGSGTASRLLATAHGTYGGAPITGQLTGGAILSLRDTAKPWPVDLRLENGTTHVRLVGTLQNPVHLSGADLRLTLAGQDMGNLQKLTGIPIPTTPPFRITGHLEFAGIDHIKLHDFEGHLGRSDIEGTIDTAPGKARMAVTADLQSHQVDLTDLGGFIGTTPGKPGTPGETPAKRAQVEQAEAKPNLLPNTPLNIPRLEWADVHLRYRGQHIINRSVPLDDLAVTLDVVNGAVDIHPVSFGVGSGRIKGDIALTPETDKSVRAKADLEFQQVDVSRLMQATHTFQGAGTLNGSGRIEATGGSLAGLLAHGNGEIAMGMAGGDLSALLVDLSGLEFGNALLSALGLPTKTPVQCLAVALPLKNGVVTLQPLILDTGEAIVHGSGTIDLGQEKLNLSLRTQPKHISIGSLPAPIDVSGTFRKPSIRPGAELALRGGLAAGLAAVFPPLALLPMVQFGTKDTHQCEAILSDLRQTAPNGGNLPAAQR
jgi:uncharacterized protein involved in outer membrane biogenesis